MARSASRCRGSRKAAPVSQSGPQFIPHSHFHIPHSEWAWVELNYRPHAYQASEASDHQR